MRARSRHASLPCHCACALLLAALAACSSGEHRVATGGDPQRGRSAIERYGCIACHAIPGVPGHGTNIGPPLVDVAKRGYLAGVLPNTPQDMVRWLRDPPAADPRTAMPALGISQQEAVDIAAYLYAH